MKINFYLDYPKHSYYEVVLNPHKETPNSIIATIFKKLFPPGSYAYSTPDPAFIHVREGATLDPTKTFFENGIDDNHHNHNHHNDNDVPDIRIRLKIIMNDKMK